MTLRSVLVHRPTEHHETGRGFSAHRFGDDEATPFMDPYLMIDAYTLSEPYFAPHPHAGFAPVTYMLPESEIGFINRDSLGTRNRIAPGDVHWMTAGRGIVHEEVPEQRGRAARGLQIFINLPQRLKFMEPGYHHMDGANVPVVEKDGAHIAVVIGQSNGVASALAPPYPVQLIDVTLEPGGVFEQAVGIDDNAFLYCFEGDCVVETPQGKTLVSAHDLVGMRRDGTIVRVVGGSRRARFVVCGGKPIAEPIVAYGPFIMGSRQDLMKIMDDYRQGRMGKVDPSRWSADGRPVAE
jgi:redox-sensitive bicupin YhaK (pirin superfamily)